MLLHPEVAHRSCSDCAKWMYNDQAPLQPGQFGRMGLIVERPINSGQHIERLPKQHPPCHWCPKIPKGAKPIPESAVELSPRNVAAYMHYRRCKAVLRFPVDPIVERNAAICLQIEEEKAEEISRLAHIETVSLMMTASVRK